MLKWGLPFLYEGLKVKFDKQALTAEEQLEVLIKRGLIIEDKKSAIDILKRIGYYRLSAYMRNFQINSNHEFVKGTNFKKIIDLYNFDRQLRLICFDAIQKIELAYRTAITNVLCKEYGSHWFLDKNTFRDENDFNNCKELIKNEIKKKNNEYAETFIAKYYEKYDEPEFPPFWADVETFTIGSLNRLYQMLHINNKRKVVEYLGFTFDKKFMVTANWLFSVCVVRNICAHHSRLFNRVFRISPTKQALINELNTDTRNTFYYLAMIINYYLKTISNDISFEEDLIRLFNKYPNVDKTKMGFPVNWSKFTITPISKQKAKAK